ncbi:helix-turn-helix domain-containing protein [Actinosynnema sp. NPDC051121]
MGTLAPYRTLRPLRPEEIDALIEAYEAGAGVKTLAKRFGVHRATVGRYLRSRGIDTTPSALTATQIKTAIELYEQGWSLAKIAKPYGVNDGTVWRKLKAAGVRMRPATNAEWVEGRKTR